MGKTGYGDALSQVLERGIPRNRAPQFLGLQEGEIVEVNTTTKTAMFKLSTNANFLYGPAPYGRTNAPVVGDKALVAFVGPGIDRPWVVMTSPTTPWK